jgi:glycosyltransferase involved in cell wall biosynthesis
MKTKLLHLITTCNVGGAEMHLLSLVKGLMQTERFDITVAFFKGKVQDSRSLVSDFESLGVKVVDLNMKSRFDLSALWRLYRLMRAEQFDLLHTHLFRADLFGLPIGKLAGIPGRVSTVHNTEDFFKNSLVGLALRRSFGFAFQLIAISEAVKKSLIEDVRMATNRIRVIHYGIENESSQIFQDTSIDIRQQFAIGENIPLIGTVGRLAAQKGHRYLIEAFAKVKRSFPTAKLLIVGHDSEGLRENLEKQIADANLAGEVFLPGYLDGAQVIQTLDIFVLPSIWEGFGLVLLEAMNAGKPIIASRITAIPEIVKDQETGLLVPPGNAQELAHAICLLLSRPDWAKTLGQSGKRRLETAFTLERMVQQTVHVYDKLKTTRQDQIKV